MAKAEKTLRDLLDDLCLAAAGNNKKTEISLIRKILKEYGERSMAAPVSRTSKKSVENTPEGVTITPKTDRPEKKVITNSFDESEYTTPPIFDKVDKKIAKITKPTPPREGGYAPVHVKCDKCNKEADVDPAILTIRDGGGDGETMYWLCSKHQGSY